VERYVAGANGSLSGQFTEVETGKRNDRPEPKKALAACRRQRARLVSAKLDRPSRNGAFIAAIMDSGVEFVACDNPHATRLTLHILAAVADGYRADYLAPANRIAAIERAKQLRPLLSELTDAGMSARQVAAELTARGIPTPCGGR
jgi:DNA invertase Pin-like site-specific DNA recombinase